MAAGTPAKTFGVSGVERAVVRGLLGPRSACRARRGTPRANRGVALAWRRGGREASVARPLRRTTTVTVCWRVVGDRGGGRGRAGNH
jgi:hypothetical protein